MIGLQQPSPQERPAKGLITFVGNDEIEQKEQEERQKAIDEAQNNPVLSSLAGHVRKCWQAARQAKQPIEADLLKALRQRKGEYDPDILRKIQAQGGSEIFIKLTDVKCRAAEAWLKDGLMPPGERPWSADPTPVPDLPMDLQERVAFAVKKNYDEAIMLQQATGQEVDINPDELFEAVRDELSKELDEQAKEDSDRLEREIDDELVEGNWYQAVKNVIYDIVTFKTGFIEGPIIRNKKKLEWAEIEDGGSTPVVSEGFTREYYRVSPFDCYPSPGAKTIQDGYFIIRKRLSRRDLNDMIGVEGFDENAIRSVLDLYGRGGLREWLVNDIDRAELENRHDENQNPEGSIDILKLWGSIQGRMLREWGMSEEEIPDADIDYDAICYLCGPFVLSARLNSHPLGKRNVFSASFVESNDSIWGQGVPELMEDISSICQGCARAIVNNMALSSGPQVWVDQSRMPPGSKVTDIFPLKVWSFEADDTGRTGTNVPMGFFQPKPIVDTLLKLYDYYFKQASEVTGIPAYIYGSENVGGAGRTASGLSMLMNAAAKSLRAVIGNIDMGIIKPSIEEHHLHIMLNEPEKAGGDINILARASEYLIMMEQLQIRRAEFLASTNNPTDLQIMGLEGRAEVLREAARSLKMNVDRIVPERDDILATKQDNQLQLMLQNIAGALNIPVQYLMQAAQGGMGAGGQSGGNQLALDGGQTGGKDFSLM